MFNFKDIYTIKEEFREIFKSFDYSKLNSQKIVSFCTDIKNVSNNFLNEISDLNVIEVKKKRERAVYYIPDKGLFFKTWVQNWTQSEITEYGIESEFYDQKNSDSLVSLLYDETGPRGYIQKAGESAAERGKSDKCWDYFIGKTSKSQRVEFMSNLLESSIAASIAGCVCRQQGHGFIEV